MCHYFVKCFIKKKKKTKKTTDPKCFMISQLRRVRSLHVQDIAFKKKQLIRSVRLLNSDGGVYFVIAAVPMSL